MLHHGLLGEHIYRGKEGALAFVSHAGCLQFDPIDPCGRNAELALHSRVEGFRKDMLWELLYRDRLLADYWDKCMCIVPVADWPCYERIRRDYDTWEHYANSALDEAVRLVRQTVLENGQCSSADMPATERIRWPWGSAPAARAALELLYFRGELVVSEKRGARKYYDLAQRHIPAPLLTAGDPFPDQESYFRWHVARRIGGVGLLWNRRSDAYLGVLSMDAAARNAAVEGLLRDGTVMPAEVEGIKWPLYFLARDLPLMECACSAEEFAPRCECIAPLDHFLWDRNLIEAIFDFNYRWEIYTPAPKRQFGYYVLPLLCGEELVGRIEPVADAKKGVLTVKNVWLEKKAPKRAVTGCMKRLAKFNDCAEIRYLGKP